MAAAQQRLVRQTLQAAYQEDESGRAAAQVATALAEMGERIQPGDQLPDLLGRRRAVGATNCDGVRKSWVSSSSVSRLRSTFSNALAALAAAAGGQAPKTTADGEEPPPSALARVADEVAGLVSGIRDSEHRERDLQAELRCHRAEVARLSEELAERDKRIAHYELGELAGSDEDRRLQLYRRAFAKLDRVRTHPPRLLRFAISSGCQRHRPPRRTRGVACLTVSWPRSAPCKSCVVSIRRRPAPARPRLLASRRIASRPSALCRAARDAARDLLHM